MMNEIVEHERPPGAMPKIKALKKLKEEIEKEQLRELQITKIREIHSPEIERDAERTKRFVGSRLSRQWSRRLNLDEIYRAPSHFTWRC